MHERDKRLDGFVVRETDARRGQPNNFILGISWKAEGEERVGSIIEIRPNAYLYRVSRVSRSRVARVEIPMNG